LAKISTKAPCSSIPKKWRISAGFRGFLDGFVLTKWRIFAVFSVFYAILENFERFLSKNLEFHRV